ncbi:MAG: hypothetical protein RLP44_06890 [Aggregatilineales bacterium]
MLIRAYRVTDKLSIVLLKSLAGIGAWLIDGAHILVQFGQRGGGGVFAAIFAVLLVLFAVIKRIVLAIWAILRRIFGLIANLLGFAGRRAGVSSNAQSSRVGASGSAGNRMARRAARAELEASIAEDPLRTQNRFLSGVVVVVLAALVVAVILATSGGGGNTPASASPAIVDLNLGNAVTTPTVPGILATAVPIATDIPELLQARGSLAFVVRERGQTDIWVTNIDNRDPIRLTSSPEDDRDPAFSPDGQQLAYASRRDGNWEIYILDMRNPLGEPTRMTFGLGFQAAPVWSPDGLFLAYESYQNNNLDIYLMAVDGTSLLPTALPSMSASAEFSPAWSPEGRQIAYVSWRDGNQDIYVYDLDSEETINLTNTPTRHEDFPAWNADGTLITYSARDEGIEKVFVKSVEAPTEPAQVIARGRNPNWSPDGNSIVFALDSFEGTQFIVEPYAVGGITTPVISVALPSDNPMWIDVPLPAALVNSGGVALGVEQPLYVEQVTPRNSDPPYGLADLPGVVGPELPNLSDRVNDSFNALRENVNDSVGSDFFGRLESAIWNLEYRPNPNEPNRNWHRTGRAFSFNRSLLLSFPAPVEVVREDTDLETNWRVFVRVDEDAQSGELGEPLRRMPWQFVTTADGDVEAYDQGGRLQTTMPAGYYVDLTQIAEDYGWERQPAGSDWRANSFTRNYWMFVKKEGLTWYEAMREIYTVGELGGFNPTPTPLPPDTETENTDSGDG